MKSNLIKIDKLVESANKENYKEVMDELTEICMSNEMSLKDLAVATIAHSAARGILYEYAEDGFDMECTMCEIAHSMAENILKGDNYAEDEVLREELGFL